MAATRSSAAGRFALEVNYPKLSQVLKLEIGNLQFVLLNIFKSLHNHSAKVALQDKMIEDLRAQLRDKIDKETGIPRIAELERKMDALHENLKKWLAPTVAKCDGHQIKIKNAEAAIDTLKSKIDMVDRRLLGKHEELFFFQIIDARPGIRRPNILAQKHVADEDLRHALVDRLQYYREYRVKDLSDGNICHFKRGTVIDGAFVMLMSLARAELATGSDDVRCYRLDKKDASGRDVFKKVRLLPRTMSHGHFRPPVRPNPHAPVTTRAKVKAVGEHPGSAGDQNLSTDLGRPVR